MAATVPNLLCEMSRWLWYTNGTVVLGKHRKTRESMGTLQAAQNLGNPHSALFSADWKLCVAPMMDWTDRHCRYFHRLLAPHARLYTEMVTADALLHGDLGRHLDFDAAEHPLAL